ncbi:MAG: hypothetical protein MZV64_01925 [Ignavibacteriales bacterium]|nr:hypothetical protein [Ignavibacteriales bacterium]
MLFLKRKSYLNAGIILRPFVKAENPKCKVNQFDNDDYLFINGRIIAPSNLKNILISKTK